jgi:hypothetical protein
VGWIEKIVELLRRDYGWDREHRAALRADPLITDGAGGSADLV